MAGQPVKAAETAAGDSAVTMWAVIFNDPQNCVGGCGEDDLDRPAVNPSVLYVTGQRVQSNGRAAFAGAISKGSPMGVLFGPGLVDPAAAEIHLIVRSHGRVIPDLLASQVSSLDGGCPPNDCTDLQFAVHLPGAADAMGLSNSLVQYFADASAVRGAHSVLRRTPNGAFAVVITRLM
jgi:hypothetical protein